jgi:hypothetical protein
LLDAWLKETGRANADTVWVPVNARKTSLIMLLDAQSGAILAALPIVPW